MEAIETRLGRLEAVYEIHDTLTRYCQSLDYGDEAALADCFTEDCAVSYEGYLTPDNEAKVRERGATIVDGAECYRGRAQMLRLAEAHSRPPDRLHKHFLSLPRIAFHQPDSASVTSYFTLLLKVEGQPRVAAFGRYDDIIVRCEDGRWRISSRRGRLEAHAGTPPLVRTIIDR